MPTSSTATLAYIKHSSGRIAIARHSGSVSSTPPTRGTKVSTPAGAVKSCRPFGRTRSCASNYCPGSHHSTAFFRDPDVVAALLATSPKNYRGWTTLLGLLPEEVQRRHPDLVLRILKGYEGCRFSRVNRFEWQAEIELAPDLWQNLEVVLALFRCGILHETGYRRQLLRPPEGVLERFENDREMWLEVARVLFRSIFQTYCPASLRSDTQFMRQAVWATHKVCLECLTGDPPSDFDLILAACASSLDFAETVASRVDYGKDLYAELKVYICREVRERASRYV